MGSCSQELTLLILRQLNLVHILIYCLSKIHLNIILMYTPACPKCFLLLQVF